MSEFYLQILLMLAYLAIGLISVTFPIFAICASYLRQELRETETEKKKKRIQIKSRITALTKDLSGEIKDTARYNEIKRVIKSQEKELDKLETRVLSITALGAVLQPLIFLVATLFFAGAGMYSYYENNEIRVVIFVLGAILFSGTAIYSLLVTVFTLEKAAIRTSKTVEFEACFETHEKSHKIKRGKEIELPMGIAGTKENVENLVARIYIPPEIAPEHPQGTLQSEKFFYPGYRMVIYEKEFVPAKLYYGPSLRLLGKELGVFDIPILISAKGISDSEIKLTIEVVE